MDETKKLECSFCAKEARQVRQLIAGPVGFICDECVMLCVDILVDRASEASKLRKMPVTDSTT